VRSDASARGYGGEFACQEAPDGALDAIEMGAGVMFLRFADYFAVSRVGFQGFSYVSDAGGRQRHDASARGYRGEFGCREAPD
jgi:hypothetical protein